LNNPYTAPTADIVDMTDDEIYEPKLFAFSGRIGRWRYLGYSALMMLIFMLIVSVLGAVAGVGMVAMRSNGSNGSMVFVGILMLFTYVPMIVMHFALMRRRLNDLDQTGWLSLLTFVPFLGILFWLYMIFAPGTKGSNRFGPMPSPHSFWIVIAALMVPLIFIGILAAVAIPAYQQYVMRAKAARIQQEIQPAQNSNP
jgi:uncharacterized membrane protein YhaH (DUF805 family)